MGGGRGRRARSASTTCAASPTSTRSARAVRRCGSTTSSSSRADGRAFGWHAIVIDGHDLNAILDALRRGAQHHGPADDDRGADDQGQGRVVRRRQGRLARQAVQEGRGARSRPRRARAAVRARPPSVDLAAQIPKPSSTPAAPAAAETDRAAGLQGGRAGRDARSVRHGARQARRSRPRGWSRSMPTSRTRPSATSSRKWRPDRFYQNFIAEQVMIGVGDGTGGARRDSVPVDVRLLPDARRRLHPDGGDQQRQHQDGRLARRRVDRRRRSVADGARGSGDVPRAAELHRALSVRRGQHRAAGGACRQPSAARSTCAPAGRRRRSSIRTTRRSRSAG